MRVEGSVSNGYEAVVDALGGCGAGVAVAAFVDGRRVVDVWTGDLSGESLICTWSAIKPVTGACLLLLVERGLIALDDPVVSMWPELGDDRLLVRHLLTHTAGRVTVPDVPLVDWDRSVAALASMEPDWPPGDVVCEHAQTFGHLVGEVVRRDRRPLARDGSWPTSSPARSVSTSTSVSATPTWPESPTRWGSIARGGPRPAANRDRCGIGRWGRGSTSTSGRGARPRCRRSTGTPRPEAWRRSGRRSSTGGCPPASARPAVTGHDRFVDEEVTWTLAGGRVDGPDVGMGGLGGQWAAARPAVGLAWAFLTTHVGDHDRAQRIEDVLVAAVQAGG